MLVVSALVIILLIHITQNDWTHIGCARTDGFGAQYQCKMGAFAMSRYKKKKYMHIPFNNVGHGESSDDVALLEAMVGMSSDSGDKRLKLKKDLNLAHVPSEYYTPAVREELRSMYFSTHKPSPIVCDVAFHVRRGDAMAHNNNYGHTRVTSNVDIYNIIKKYFSDTNVCIFSEGIVSDFEMINTLENVNFELNTDLRVTFHSMVVAPRLVTAKSSLSFTAGILNPNKVYYLETFWHTPLDDWTMLKG